MPTDIIGTAEACTILGCDKSTVSRMVTAGKLVPVVKNPGPTGAMMFHRADIEELAAARLGQ
jgi:predicted site-specific integrase-resolvase